MNDILRVNDIEFLVPLQCYGYNLGGIFSLSLGNMGDVACLNQTWSIVDTLSPTQEHFLKKYLLQHRLFKELDFFYQPGCCKGFGYPFSESKGKEEEIGHSDYPLFKYFFYTFVETFPLVSKLDRETQDFFWQDVLMPFIESFNSKGISETKERAEDASKRKQVNSKVVSSLLLFYNSMLITNNDIAYFKEPHLQSYETSFFSKLLKKPEELGSVSLLDDYGSLDNIEKKTFINDVSLNVVAVKYTTDEITTEEESKSSLFGKVSGFFVPRRTTLLVPGKKARKHFFVIQGIRRTKREESGFKYKRTFIARSYSDFREFHDQLKSRFPGLAATELPKLPPKIKHDDGVDLDYVSDDDEQDLTSHSSQQNPSIRNSHKSNKVKKQFDRERLRLALRGYIVNLSKLSEIVKSETYLKFFFDSDLTYDSLSVDELRDHQVRVGHEKCLMETQIEFQRKTATTLGELSLQVDQIKNELIKSPHYLSEIFDQMGNVSSSKEIPDTLKIFVEWCKLQVCATLYQVFLGVDNSSEWLSKCKKFHALFPYFLVYQILKFTNPTKIVSSIIRLLLAEIPSFSPQWFGDKFFNSTKDARTSSRNLLSYICIVLLDEDLNDYKKEIKLIKGKLLEHQEINIFVERIESYVDAKDDSLFQLLEEESLVTKKDFFLCVLSSDKIEPPLLDSDKQAYDEIKRSYESETSAHDNTYVHLKEYWHLLLRKRDKDLIKQLWKEPELTYLIKKSLELFYQPLVQLLARFDIHIFFKDFEKFMDDLMKELERLDNGDIYFSTPMEIHDVFKSVINRHEESFWLFFHKLYSNDKEKIFLHLVEWIELFLRTFQMKFKDPLKVSLDLNLLQVEITNKDLLIAQLNGKIEKTLHKRQLLKHYTELKSRKNQPKSQQEHVDASWKELNEGIFNDIHGTQFGLNDDDVIEYNFYQVMADSRESENLDVHDKEVFAKLLSLEREINEADTSEIDKLDPSFTVLLQRALSR